MPAIASSHTRLIHPVPSKVGGLSTKKKKKVLVDNVVRGIFLVTAGQFELEQQARYTEEILPGSISTSPCRKF